MEVPLPSFQPFERLAVPHLLRHTPESRADCRGMVRRLEYIPEGQAVGLLLCLNTWNYFQVTASGELEAFTVHM
ncbi:MAG: hypothetical protein GY696_03405, partial [Gammaproteobacteria bacterium]|nr:hypothetical protein [Gammaproteobacteria bacterium]